MSCNSSGEYQCWLQLSTDSNVCFSQLDNSHDTQRLNCPVMYIAKIFYFSYCSFTSLNINSLI